jgi:hypothetical protein
VNPPEIQRALVETGDGVRRATLDVAVGGDAALVSLATEQGRTRLVCSCGGAPTCRHAMLALAWLEGHRGAEPPSRRSAASIAPPPSPSTGEPIGMRPAGSETQRPPPGITRAEVLATALDDLVTTVVRAGVRSAAGTPSFEESLRRVASAAPAPLPGSLGRTLGRLVEALGAQDISLVARLCHGLARFGDGLRGGDARLVQTWLGGEGAALLGAEVGRSALDGPQPDPAARLVDVRLVEIAREWVSTLDRSGLERRYLVAPALGRIYREERLRGHGAPSLGPCPRVLDVALAEVEPGPAPQRLQLLQYEVALVDTPDVLAGVVARGNPDFSEMIRDFAAAIGAFPALAEPFALLAPRAVARIPGGAALVDGAGQRLTLSAESVGVGELLNALADASGLPLLCGRVVADRGAVSFTALSAIVRAGPAFHLRRLT